MVHTPLFIQLHRSLTAHFLGLPRSPLSMWLCLAIIYLPSRLSINVF